MSSNVPIRAAKELYYKPFQAAVDAGVGSAMCSCEFGCVRWLKIPASFFLTSTSPHTLHIPNRQSRQWDLGL